MSGEIPTKMSTDEASHVTGEEASTESTPESELKQAEKNEEAKLKAKYPQALRPGVSGFLQKRLQRGQKYFDSGDYNMAKAKGQKPRATVPIVSQLPTGEAIPTPDNLPPRKTSMVQSKLATELSTS